MIEDNYCKIVRVTLFLIIEWVGIPGTRVGLISSLIVRVEGHRHTRGSLIAVSRGKENRRRDQRSRAVQPGAIRILAGRHQPTDVWMPSAIQFAIRNGLHGCGNRQERDEY